jgi:hypothetical protein
MIGVDCAERHSEFIGGHIRVPVIVIRHIVHDRHLIVLVEGVVRAGVQMMCRDIITEVLFGLPTLAEKCGHLCE